MALGSCGYILNGVATRPGRRCAELVGKAPASERKRIRPPFPSPSPTMDSVLSELDDVEVFPLVFAGAGVVGALVFISFCFRMVGAILNPERDEAPVAPVKPVLSTMKRKPSCRAMKEAEDLEAGRAPSQPLLTKAAASSKGSKTKGSNKAADAPKTKGLGAARGAGGSAQKGKKPARKKPAIKIPEPNSP